MDQVVMLRVDEFRSVVDEIKAQVTKDVKGLKSLVVEQPMTRKEAAQYLRIHINTLDQKIRRGDIPSKLVHYNGTTPYFFASELRDFLKES